MNDNDYDIEPIWERDPDKKRKNSGRKGKRGESGLCKILTERFGQPFARVPQSGAIGSTRVMSEHVREAYVGDIVTPQYFRFCLEVKHGYSEIDLYNVLCKGWNATLQGFMDQCERDAERVGRAPMVCWKRDRQPWLAFIRCQEWEELDKFITYDYVQFCNWRFYPLKNVLAMPDAYFFRTPA